MFRQVSVLRTKAVSIKVVESGLWNIRAMWAADQVRENDSRYA